MEIEKRMKEAFMKRAIELARKNISSGGGPFGALIVKDGELIAEASNHVTLHNDPTAHAEVEAIRMAGEKMKTFDLSDCEIYASCEPCPMCLGAIYWARIPTVYYASDRYAAEDAGFDDSKIYDEISKSPDVRELNMHHMDMKEAAEVFRKWKDEEDKLPY